MKIYCNELNQVLWHSRSRCDYALHDQSHIWLVDLENLTPEQWVYWASFLNEEEILHLKKYHFEKDRQQFVGGRSVLRQLLSRYLKVAPQKIPLRKTRSGKLFVDSLRYRIRFNLSHSGSKILIGLNQKNRIGIDLEQLNPIQDVRAVVENLFSDNEQKMVRTNENNQSFYKLWTRKEALVKASGSGLVDGVAALEVSAHINDVVMNIPAVNKLGLGPFRCTTFGIGEDYLASVAVDQGSRQFNFFRFR